MPRYHKHVPVLYHWYVDHDRNEVVETYRCEVCGDLTFQRMPR